MTQNTKRLLKSGEVMIKLVNRKHRMSGAKWIAVSPNHLEYLILSSYFSKLTHRLFVHVSASCLLPIISRIRKRKVFLWSWLNPPNLRWSEEVVNFLRSVYFFHLLSFVTSGQAWCFTRWCKCQAERRLCFGPWGLTLAAAKLRLSSRKKKKLGNKSDR